MTRRLYYDDASTASFSAPVVEAWLAEGRAHVVLEASYFYPTSGGQMHDRGTLGGAPVLDVVDEGDRVVHVLDTAEAPEPGAVLEGEVDAERRAHHRQQHSGQHVLSRVVEDRLGLPTVSSRLGETGNTLDLEVDDLEWDTLEAIEDEVNRILWEGRPVRVRYVTPDEAGDLGLGKIPDREGPLRVIEVEGLDTCACGGTHVANTAEIGLVAIHRKERFKGGLRLHFLCGQRAVEFRRERAALVRRLSTALTTGDDQLEALVTRLPEELKRTQKDLLAARRDALLAAIPEWIGASTPLEGIDGNLVCRGLPAGAGPVAGEIAGALGRAGDVLAVLTVPDGDRTQLLVARGGRVAVDCNAALRRMLDTLDGRGGGRPDHARGSFPGIAPDPLEPLVRKALEAG